MSLNPPDDPHYTPNELRVDLLASGGWNPWAQHDSSSRVQMIGSHLSQALVMEGATPRRNVTGIEREFGRFTFSIKMPANGEVLRIIHKYPRTLSRDAIRENPLTTIIYEDNATKHIGVVSVPRYHCRHQHFGFRYKHKQALSRLSVGSTIAKGTILSDSPSIDDQGNYKLGLEANVVFMSVPGVIEDGVIISKSLAKRMTTMGFEKRSVNWGTHLYPLNLYGNDKEYKPFPDIGDRIREDGLLFALRRYDPLLAPVEMSPAALREPDYIFDQLVYGEPGAKVIDVNVHHDTRSSSPPTPTGMEVQAKKYYDAQLQFYNQLIDEHRSLIRKRGTNNILLTPEFHALLFEAYAYRPDPKMRATQIYQRQPLDDWRVEVAFEYGMEPIDAFKLTDLHGGKGVACAVWEDEDMPVDANGNRAEAIMDGEGTIKRMNIGRMYEQYLNATSRMVTEKIRYWMDNPTDDSVDMAWQYVLGYYQIVSPRMYEMVTGPSFNKTPRAHLEHIVKDGNGPHDGVKLYMPTDNPAESVEIIKELVKHYPIAITPVTYRGRSGNVVTTKVPVLVGSLYLILLEKTGGDWSGVASSKLQHFGLPAKLSKFDKYSLPGRATPVRIMGETEVRLLAACVGGAATAELLEMSNNPIVHKNVVTNILRAENVSNIEHVINRAEVPSGGSRSLLYTNHSLQCAGIEFFPVKYSEKAPLIYAPLE